MRVRSALKKRLEKLAGSTGRSRSFLAQEALAAYLDANEWQVAGIKAARASLDRGEGVPHARVNRVAARLDQLQPLQAGVPFLGNDDVIMYGDT
jgi:predicted transcriptional regulator